MSKICHPVIALLFYSIRYTTGMERQGVFMNQTYGRLVSRAAIAATVMASLLLLIKIFAWWYTGSVSILAALVDSLVDIAASLTNLLVVRYSLQPHG